MPKHKDTTVLGLYIKPPENDGRFFHLNATVVSIGLNAYERRMIDEGRPPRADVSSDTIRNYVRDEDVNGLRFYNLLVAAQGNNDDAVRHLYGFEVEYRDVYSVNASIANAMHKTLRIIELRMHKLDEKYGRPVTFGAYLARVAAAIGATKFVFPANVNASSYRDREHRIVDLHDGIYRVDGIVREWERERDVAEPVRT